ncbi:MAG: histidine ammonia-lyase [Chloroflexi bacterium RBG_16_72_14]|nr:MAG: histidine ammonia-lyase [Chloroflexi bacterium RBG_16_72_14]
MTDAHFAPSRTPARDPGDLVVLTGADLEIGDVEAVARHGARAALDVHARERMAEARAVIDALVERGEVVYGVTTGFGDLATTFIPPGDAARLQESLLASHAAGVGRPFPREVVRAMLLLRANTLALGHSGCRPLLVDRVCAFLALGIHPVVPEQGSVGASGDLAPLAHLALPLVGRGEVELGGQVMPALVALREVGLEPLVLQPKEGLALLNGTQLMSAIGALLLADADRLVRTASVAAAMSVEALLGTEVAFAAPYQLARPHPGQLAVAAELRHLLRDSGLQRAHHGSAHKVQDPYSLRCVPQVHGAVRDALDHLRRVLDIELNSATDNPLVFPAGGDVPTDALATGGGLVISGGNFHGEPIALALDFAKLALSELGAISERRTALLLDPRLSGGLPAFLSPDPGRNSGLMIVQYTAAALASENKVLAHPSSADSIPTSANQEDHVSMGATAARHARTVLGHVEQIVAIELLCAAQALELRLGTPARDAATPGAGVAEALRRIRERVPRLVEDREPGPDMAAMLALVHAGALADLVAGQAGREPLTTV